MKTTPKRVIANNIYYNLFYHFLEQSQKSRFETFAEFCLKKVKEEFKDLVSYMIYRRQDFKDAEQTFTQIWHDIRQSFEMILESSQLSWFDDKAREYTLEKLHWMKMVVPSFKDIDLDAKYAQLMTNSTANYFENLKSLLHYKALTIRNALNSEPDYIEMALQLTTATYIQVGNLISISVGALNNEYYYSKYYPYVLHVSRLGFTIGHEILHGFSGSGRNYNKLGNYQDNWSEDQDLEFEERRQCLYDQYHNYIYGGIRLPQDESQDENAADVGGILLAYRSYRRWYEDDRRTQEERDLEILPNLNYTNKQLFFINYSQSWCIQIQEDLEMLNAKTDSHSPDQIRAYVPLTNLKEFSEVFHCPLGSGMNPVKKCNVY